MNLALREGYSIKFCMKLTAVTSNNNYYSQFSISVFKWYNNRFLPLIRQLFLIQNEITEFVDSRH
jgi:hypothetical protein